MISGKSIIFYGNSALQKLFLKVIFVGVIMLCPCKQKSDLPKADKRFLNLTSSLTQEYFGLKMWVLYSTGLPKLVLKFNFITKNEGDMDQTSSH